MATSRGYTLIELLMVLGIVCVIFAALVTFFISANSTFRFQNAFMETKGSASTAAAAVREATLPATRVMASAMFPSGTFSTGSSTLVLELPSVTSSGAIIADTYDHVAFYAIGSTMYEETSAGSGSARVSGKKSLSSTVQALSFGYDTSDATQAHSVSVSITTQEAAGAQTAGGNIQQTTTLRNAS